jgi:tRNA(Ile2) C34 agmatinyltransferase TiaS
MAKPYSVFMYYETDGDAGYYDIALFSTRALAEAYQIQKNDAYGKVDEIKVDARAPESPYSDPICPDCGGEMVSRKGKYGIFWGCKKYPRCSGTRDSEGKSKEDREREKAEKEQPEPIDPQFRFRKG